MKKKALLIGAGGMGRSWAKTIEARGDAELIGWVDISEAALRSALEETGIEPMHQGTDLAGALRINPDFVVDATVPEAHCGVTVQCLDSGIPVLGEKPMASSMEEAAAMVKASESANRLYMVSQSRRYHSGLSAFRRLIQRELGNLGILNVDFFLGPHFGGFRDRMPSPLVLDMAIHTFDAARALSGLDAESVYAEEFNPPWSWYEGDACATAIFQMAGGARFQYRGSWCAEGCMTSWEGDWRAVGSSGTAIWHGDTAPDAEVAAGAGGFFSELRAVVADQERIPEGIEGSLGEFLSALDTGATPQGECHDNIKSLAMVFAAIRSAALGRRVALSEELP